MLNKVENVQVSDTTEVDSSSDDHLIINFILKN